GLYAGSTGALHGVGTQGGGAVGEPILLSPRLRPLTVAGFVLAVGLAAAPATAQLLYGSVVGIVKDSSGSVIPGATVTIVNKDTNLTREAATDGEGGKSASNRRPRPNDVNARR